MLKEDNQRYHYKNDRNIPIGVLSMVDDSVDIAKCGSQSIQKNAGPNSFIENQRLELSKEKSSVIHVGNPNKYKEKCPKLKVYDSDMINATSAKYLGDIVQMSDPGKGHSFTGEAQVECIN